MLKCVKCNICQASRADESMPHDVLNAKVRLGNQGNERKTPIKSNY